MLEELICSVAILSNMKSLFRQYGESTHSHDPRILEFQAREEK